MGILDRFKDMFQGGSNPPLDVSARFQLQKESFMGTMSKFQVAREISTGRTLGIKFLDSEKTDLFKARFKGLEKPVEGEIAIQIVHKRVVSTYEFGLTTHGQEYILMEYINGPGVNTLLKHRDEKMVKNRLTLLRQIAEGIEAVHEAGFIHRDICPRNFICNSDMKWLKLIDFGLTVPDLPPYRLPGNRTGTPQYMAPEIVRRRPTDNRVDIFAFGVTAFRMLTFEHPWGSTDTTGVGALKHDSRPATDILKYRPQLDQRLARAIHRCLEVKPEDRFDSIGNFLAAIRSVKTEDEQ